MSYEEKRQQLIEKLKRERRIISPEVEKAFLETPRELFVPDPLKKYAYIDSPLEIGNGQTISAPHMIAIMIEELDLRKDQKVLEIGAGSGYHAAIVAKIIGGKGHIYTIDRFETLAEYATENLKNANIKNVTVETGDGSEGLLKYAPYDRIYVTCAAPDIPQPLVDQLRDPGKLMVPVGRMLCSLKLVEKKENNLTIFDLGGCAFVPLVGKHGH
jgi:protein-L-isoaspartate(D-aspartate) O-methyltransferase